MRETWRDALDERVNLDHFELVRMTKPGQKTTSWTWRYEKQRYDDLRALIIENIAKKRRRFGEADSNNLGFAGFSWDTSADQEASRPD